MASRLSSLASPVALGVAGGLVAALVAAGIAHAVDEVVISEPQFDAPRVMSPQPGEDAAVVTDSDGEDWWILEVTNSDYQPNFDIDTGYVGFETLPSVGVFDTVEQRLAWTNETFACFLDDSCDVVPRTEDQEVFGEDFVRLPKLYDATTGAVAYHAEHASLLGQEPYEWLVAQDTLSLAIPLDGTPTGGLDVWVGYTYIYTDDLVGVPVRFTREAMAITEVQVVIPEAGVPATEIEASDQTSADGDPLPTWVVSAVVGLIGILLFFGLVALTVSRGVVLARKNKQR